MVDIINLFNTFKVVQLLIQLPESIVSFKNPSKQIMCVRLTYQNSVSHHRLMMAGGGSLWSLFG